MRARERWTAARPTRREILAAACAALGVVAKPALGQGLDCPVGPPPHTRGPPVFLDYDQVELDAAYFQPAYEPNYAQVLKRLSRNSEITRTRLGPPLRISYGPTDIEKLDIYRTKRPNAPIFIF